MGWAEKYRDFIAVPAFFPKNSIPSQDSPLENGRTLHDSKTTVVWSHTFQPTEMERKSTDSSRQVKKDLPVRSRRRRKKRKRK